MDPWLAGIGALLEGRLQAAHEEGNALELLFVDLVRACCRGASLLATSNEHLGHMCRAGHSVIQVNPFTFRLVPLQVVQHCIQNGRVGVVGGCVALNCGAAFHVFHDGNLHVESSGQHGSGRVVAFLNFRELDVVLRRRVVQHCVEKLIKGLHLFLLLALSTWSVGGFKLSVSSQNSIQLFHVQGSEDW